MSAVVYTRLVKQPGETDDHDGYTRMDAHISYPRILLVQSAIGVPLRPQNNQRKQIDSKTRALALRQIIESQLTQSFKYLPITSVASFSQDCTGSGFLPQYNGSFVSHIRP